MTRLRGTVPRHFALAGALIAMVLFGLLSSAGSARADISGQLDAWGEFGDAQGKMLDPSFMGVDTADGSVFVASYDFDFSETRIQKFSEAGDFEGSVSLPGFEGYVGIAVDAANERFYVLESSKSGANWVASKILAFDTTPNASGELEEATVPDLPVPTGSDALITPREVVVDQNTGDLLILAEDEAQKLVLQRIEIDAGGTGTVGPAFVDSRSSNGESRAIAISPLGVTYILSVDSSGENFSVSTLPADFTASSTLAPLPGLTALVPPSARVFFAESPSPGEGVNYGPQAAVSTSATGEETLFWKTNVNEEAVIHGWSVQGETWSVLFGGGATVGSCKIQVKRAALTSGSDENLIVLDQGDEVFTEGASPAKPPIVSRFGPGGSDCPAPGAAFSIESGGHPVSSVTAGSAVTLNGSASELHGATVESVTWKVTGAETFSETGTSLSASPAGRFAEEGTYSIRLIFDVAGGESFSAPAQTLTVTPGSGTREFPLAFTPSGTGSGSFECAVGDGAAGTCLGSYPEGASVTVTPKPATGSKFVNWTGDCSGTGACTVTMTAAHSVGAVFDAETVTPPTEFALTITAPINGSISCDSGTGVGKCAAKYPAGTVVAVTATPAAGFEFAGWTGDCLGATTCSLRMDRAHGVGASFRAAATSKPGGGGTSNPGGGTSNPGGGTSNPGGGTPNPGGGKTPAQKLQEQRRKAIAKCKKLKGKSKAKCMKKANQIGKPKPKHKKK